jgi:hypothetical protein
VEENEELQNIIRQIKSRRMRWKGHVVRMGEKCTRFWWKGQKERDHLENQGVDGSEWILGRMAE